MAVGNIHIDDKLIREMLRTAGFLSPARIIHSIAVGMLNNVFAVTFDDLSDAILRVRTFQSSEYGQQFAGERFAYYLIDPLDIPIAKLHYVEDDPSKHGYPFAVFERVQGPTFDEFHSNPATPREQIFEVLASLADSLSRIHHVRVPGYGLLTEVWFGPDQGRGFWGKLFRAETGRLALFDPESSVLYAKAVEVWLDILDNLPPPLRQPRLCHGDVHGRNIMIPGDGRAVLIDWEASRFRTAPYDFAQLRYLNFRDDEEAWTHLINCYLKSSGTDIDEDMLREAIDIYQAFWQMRMGLFLRQFPSGEGAYFGTASGHIADAGRFVLQTLQRRASK